MRYVAAPPVSSDDLETLSEVPSRLFTTDNHWPTVVSTIMSVVDRQRFPWLLDDRAPPEREREAAITATASQMASKSNHDGAKAGGEEASGGLPRKGSGYSWACDLTLNRSTAPWVCIRGQSDDP
jgi:hypothetical protein